MVGLGVTRLIVGTSIVSFERSVPPKTNVSSRTQAHVYVEFSVLPLRNKSVKYLDELTGRPMVKVGPPSCSHRRLREICQVIDD